MLRITRLTDYATAILSYMAKNQGLLVNAKTLADSLRIGPATVSKILKILTRHDLLVSQRGAEGGYRLARSPDTIPVTAIIAAMEGPLGITECALSQETCQQAGECGVQGHWQQINQVILNALKEISLADFTKEAHHNPFVIQPHEILNRVKLAGVK